MPKTRQKICFTLDADYSAMLRMVMRYDRAKGTPSEYLGRECRETLPDTTCDLWNVGHLWVPRRILRRAAGDLAAAAGESVQEEVAYYMALYDEAHGEGWDAPFWIPSGDRLRVQVAQSSPNSRGVLLAEAG